MEDEWSSGREKKSIAFPVGVLIFPGKPRAHKRKIRRTRRRHQAGGEGGGKRKKHPRQNRTTSPRIEPTMLPGWKGRVTARMGGENTWGYWYGFERERERDPRAAASIYLHLYVHRGLLL